MDDFKEWLGSHPFERGSNDYSAAIKDDKTPVIYPVKEDIDSCFDFLYETHNIKSSDVGAVGFCWGPKENPSSQAHPIYYEPEGIALSYLVAGAPCVVGNLWDVTDRDIDRYCLTLIEDFVKGQGDSLAKCVAEARRACKLRYIVGSAPVCYGVPIKCSSR